MKHIYNKIIYLETNNLIYNIQKIIINHQSNLILNNIKKLVLEDVFHIISINYENINDLLNSIKLNWNDIYNYYININTNTNTTNINKIILIINIIKIIVNLYTIIISHILMLNMFDNEFLLKLFKNIQLENKNKQLDGTILLNTINIILQLSSNINTLDIYKEYDNDIDEIIKQKDSKEILNKINSNLDNFMIQIDIDNYGGKRNICINYILEQIKVLSRYKNKYIELIINIILKDNHSNLIELKNNIDKRISNNIILIETMLNNTI